jgi:hypothetical protein
VNVPLSLEGNSRNPFHAEVTQVRARCVVKRTDHHCCRTRVPRTVGRTDFVGVEDPLQDDPASPAVAVALQMRLSAAIESRP